MAISKLVKFFDLKEPIVFNAETRELIQGNIKAEEDSRGYWYIKDEENHTFKYLSSFQVIQLMQHDKLVIKA